MDNLYADIIIDIAHRSVDRPFTYIVPDRIRSEIVVGCNVVVEFGTSMRHGYVIDLKSETDVEKGVLKEIIEISKEKIKTEDHSLLLAIWMKERYGTTFHKALMTVMPVKDSVQRKNNTILTLALDNPHGIIEKLLDTRKTAWARVLVALTEAKNREMTRTSLIKETKVSSLVLARLVEEGYIVEQGERIYQSPFKHYIEEIEKREKTQLILNAEQKKVLNIFADDYQAHIRKTYLLHGITGSGKTAVYMEMMKKVIEEERQVILLIPEIGLTRQTVFRLLEFFGDRVAIIHSKLSKMERYTQFARFKNMEADIMVGPRSAIFAPAKQLGLIVIDEEHDGAYKNDHVPRYDVRDVAKKLAKLTHSSLILASATPTPKSYLLAKQGEYTLLTLSHRAVKESSLARTQIVDMRKEMIAGNKSIFSRKLKILIEDRLEKKEQVILFMNRRGYSTFVSCRSCGEAIKCKHCDISMTLHKDNRLFCHYCGASMPMPKLCPKCKSPYIAGFGIGTQKLESLCIQTFKDARVLRLDTDSTVGKESGEQILSAFAKGEADILIGTQMVVKGHDFSNVTLVGIMAADTSLFVSDYTASQRTFELITQAAGRAGRRSLAGDVIIQTYKPEHYAIIAAAKQNYEMYFSQESAYRKIGNYPPFVSMMTIQISSQEEVLLSEVVSICTRTCTQMCKEEGGIFMGPIQPFVYKVHDYYRKLVYIKHREYAILLRMKKNIDKIIEAYLPDVSAVFDFT